MKITTLLILTLCGSLFAADFPEWASQAVAQVDLGSAPKDTGYWTLLDQTQIAYRSGKYHRTRRIVRVIMQQQDAEEASIYIVDGEEKNTRIESLKGWHRRADGSVEKLVKKNILTLGYADTRYMSREVKTYAYFNQANRGDVVAFESEENENNLFTSTTISLMASQPIALKIIDWSGDSGSAKLQTSNFEAWGLKAEQREGHLEIRNIPRLRDEWLAPDDMLFFPYVNLAFLSGDSDPCASWDSLARWYAKLFQEAAGSAGAVTSDKAPLEKAATAMAKAMTYRQVYLEPGRGWKPLAGGEVERRAYGDCKDLSACMAFKLAKDGVAALPALARIATQFQIDANQTASPYVFNHVIVAIPLAQSLGYAAEVEAGNRRFLLYDPTDRYTPLGQLRHSWKGRKLMICDADGAHWVSVPEAALNRAEIRFGLVGALDANNSFKGQWTVREQGDALGLLSSLNEGSERDMVNRLREELDLPGLVTLAAGKPQIDPGGVLSLTLEVAWPGFLQRDAGGLRLPSAIVGASRIALDRVQDRQLPLWVEEQAPRAWHLEVQGMTGLAAMKDSWSWQDTHTEFSWKASLGESFVADYHHRRAAARYSLAELEAGLKAWEAYRHDYDKFLINATCFYRN